MKPVQVQQLFSPKSRACLKGGHYLSPKDCTLSLNICYASKAEILIIGGEPTYFS